MGVAVSGKRGVPPAEPVRDRLAREACRVLVDNWRGHSTVPSRGLYPHQWSWDSAFIALGWQHLAPDRAATELLSLLGAQWEDGRVPHIVFNPAVAEGAYFPGPTFWASAAQPGSPPVDTSGIIQPPVHAVAAARVVGRLRPAAARSFAERAYPRLAAQHAYLRERRTVSSGLAAVVHPWETGLDNSPAWDCPLAAVPADLSLFASYTRRDVEHAGAGERPTDADYARYIRLALAYRDSGYDDAEALRSGEFCVVDPAFNALWAWSELAMAELAEYLDEDAGRHRAEADRLTAALVAELWSGEQGIFVARDERAGRVLAERSVAGLVPLVLPGLAVELVDPLVDTLTGPAFRGRDGEVRGVPSFDRTDPRYDPQRYWRGPTWLNTSWLVLEGLRRHGRGALATDLAADLVALVAESGFAEYFDPAGRTGHGTGDFGWSAALLLDELVRHPAPG